MNGIRKVFSILLLCFAYDVLSNDLEPVLTPKADGFRIAISDKSYDYVGLTYNIDCSSYGKQVPKKKLRHDSSRKEWFDEITNTPLCKKYGGKVFYKVVATDGHKLRKSEGTIQIEPPPPPPPSTTTTSTTTTTKKPKTTTEPTTTTTTTTTTEPTTTKRTSTTTEPTTTTTTEPTTTTTTTTEPTTTTTTTKVPCTYSKTTFNNNEEICSGDLIFEDNFDVMNWTTWKREVRIPLSSSDADFVSFQDSERNLYIKDGILYIVPTLLEEMADYNGKMKAGNLDLGPKCTGKLVQECKRKAGGRVILPPIVSSRIGTKFSFKYGKVEIRAKMPKGDWIFPQIFLEPQNNEYGSANYSSGQIRLAFIRGNDILESLETKYPQIDGYRLYGGVVLLNGAELRVNWMESILKRFHFGDDYHVYTMIWTDESITFKVDGSKFGQLNGDFAREAFNDKGIAHAEIWHSGGKMAPFDKEFYLTLGVSAGGISDFPNDSKGRNDRGPYEKPWKNKSPRNELDFWNKQTEWHRSWMDEDVGLKIDYVRVTAL